MENKQDRVSGVRFGCPSCGSGMRYDISRKKMLCAQCGEEKPVSFFREEDGSAEDSMDAVDYVCPQCGATLYTAEKEATSFCAFCGSDVVLIQRLSRKKKPAWIIPFQVSREQCEFIYKANPKRYFLSPRHAVDEDTLSHFRAVYVPFWSYRVRIQGKIQDFDAVKIWRYGDTRYEEIYRIKDLDVKTDHSGIFYDASTAFEDETARQLGFLPEQMKPFCPAYLSGMYAQAPDVDAEIYRDEALATALQTLINDICEKNNLSSIKLPEGKALDECLPDTRVEAQLVMVPVWLLTQRQGSGVVYTAINGYGGHCVSDPKISLPRIAALTSLIAALLFLLLYFLLTLKPDWTMAVCAALAGGAQVLIAKADREFQRRYKRMDEPRPDERGGAPFRGPAARYLENLQKWTRDWLDALKPEAEEKTSRESSAAFETIKIFGYIIMPLAPFIIAFGMSMADEKLGISIACSFLLLELIGFGVLYVKLKLPSGILNRLRLAVTAAVGAGFLALLANIPNDLIYYACILIILGATVWSLIIMVMQYNAFVSRPVPFFGGKEGEQ